MRALILGLLLAGLMTGCAQPPESAYVAGKNASATTEPIGNNSAGEACRRLNLGDGAADLYCGAWERPSARIRPGGPTAGGDAQELFRLVRGDGAATAWRSDIDARFACPTEPRRTTILGGAPAVVMECQYRNGGFPQLVLVAAAGGRIWYADTIGAAFEVTQRAIAALAGLDAAAAAATEPDPELAARLAARAFKAGDALAYQRLIREAADANRQGNTSASEKLFREVLELQEKLLPRSDGRDNPDLANTVMSLGLQLSNQGRTAEAEASFARAQYLIGADGGDPTTPPAGSDPTARARLFQYRAIAAANAGQPQAALPLLAQAEAAYRPLAEPALNRPAGAASFAVEGLQNTAVEALFGLIDTKRNRAWVLRQLRLLAASELAAQDAERLSERLQPTASHWRERETAFVWRTHGLTLTRSGDTDHAIGLFESADHDFTLAYRASRPQAETKLHAAAALLIQGRPDQALARCREAMPILDRHTDGVEADLMAPCLAAFASAAQQLGNDAAAQPVLAEMFAAAQRIRSSQTNQQVQQAARRMSENARDPRTGELIRKREEVSKQLDDLERQRQFAAQPQATDTGAAPPDPAALARLDSDIETKRREAATLEETLQAASPSYNQLVPKVVSAQDVLKALRPGEAFVATVLGADSGWTFLLHEGRLSAGRIDGGLARVSGLVKRVRATLEQDQDGRVHGFDMAASHELYRAVLGPIESGLGGVTALTVAPTGPLLSVPFAVLLTEPTVGHDYLHAPWLVRRFAITHVPEPGNFIALRKVAGTSQAKKAWFGFGAAQNVSLEQAQATFPLETCVGTAQTLAGLNELKGTLAELAATRAVLNAGIDSQQIGAAFTVDTVAKLPLAQYRILHFAAHGLLPTDLACQSEPAIVASPPPGARDASAALLTASRIERLVLDAELVILSACNSAGPDGTSSGESMSGLARSFFAANARALLISHWSVDDTVPTTLVPAALDQQRTHPGLGIAGALRIAQLDWLDTRGKDTSHPTFWGAMAVFGEGGSGVSPQ